MKEKDSKAARRRLQAERREVERIEENDPVRRRVLDALGREPTRPTKLARKIGAEKESVSRTLGLLDKEGLVLAATDPDDRRGRVYSLTAAGRQQLGRHLAFGPPDPAPPPPGHEEVAGFLREALDGAIQMRRRTNRLQDAIDRLQEIYAEAEAIGEQEVALEALAELAASQRQDRQRKARVHSLAVLEKISAGAPGVAPSLVLPAVAHLEYERGREADLGGADLGTAAQRLIAARSLYSGLLEDQDRPDTASWRYRRAWSVFSLAGVLRQQSRYELALEHAALALRMFDELEDPYGRAHCWFMFGFCLRLLRRFDEAWSCLRHAHGIADGSAFERARSNCLMQMGDVRRCQGKTAEAKEMLEEAFRLAGSMDLLLTQAFARSAIGAAEFQEGDHEGARSTLEAAQELFARAEHPEGIALNARRQATVARYLSGQGIKPDTPTMKALIRTAQETYEAVGSPTGVAACEVERGWLRLLSPSCGKVEPVVRRLTKMLAQMRESPHQELVLLLDAWLPTVLNDFAKQVDKDLASETEDVYESARRKLAGSGELSLETINEVGDRIRTKHETQGSAHVIEMGGESRREREPLLLAAA
jgi:DNA-binding MarR family transcriptional regulator